jgi:hypothetical protein
MGTGGKLGKSLLREVQEVRRNERPEESKAEEWKACNEGHLPEVQHEGLQNRRLKPLPKPIPEDPVSESTDTPSTGFF